MSGAGRDGRPPHIIHVMEWLAPIGGTEQVATQLALAAKRRGGTVTVIACRPVRDRNRYAEELGAGGVQVHSPSALRWGVLDGVLTAVSAVAQVALFPLALVKRGGPRAAWSWLAREIAYCMVQPLQRRAHRRWLVRRLSACGGSGALVQVHFYNHLACAALAWAQQRGVPCIWHYHASMNPGLRAYYREILSEDEVKTLGAADAVVVLAPCIAEGARDLLGPRASVHVIPNWVALPGVPRELTEQETYTVGALGRLVPNKGFEDLIEALALCRDRGNTVRCLVAGDGPLRGDLEALAARREVQSEVEFVGPVPPDRVDDFLARLDVLVMPSLSEGMPMAVLQAMASGLPVVGTAVGGTAELVRPGTSGLLVPPGDSAALADALAELAGDPERRRRMGEAGRAIVESQFTESSVWPKWDVLYELLHEGSRGGKQPHAPE